jgi:hypothetical protein
MRDLLVLVAALDWGWPSRGPISEFDPAYC